MHEIVIFNALRGKDGTVLVSYVDESTSKSGAWILPVEHPELSQCRTMDEFKQVLLADTEYLCEWEEIARKLTDWDALGEATVEVEVELPEDLAYQMDALSQALGVSKEEVGLAAVRLAVDPETQDILRSWMLMDDREGEGQEGP